jgi:hypothetical protein
MKKSFSAWMALVDAAISAKIGLSSSDLPDCPFMDWWEDGMSAASAAKKALKNAEF